MRILNDHFDKIYVITLARATERQKNVKRFFEGVDFDFFYGIDKMNLNMEDLINTKVYDPEKAKKLHRNNKEMFLGQIACSLSHRELYKEILQKGYKKVLIMEDDFVPAAVENNDIQNITAELPADWELVYWGYYLNEAVTFKMRVKKSFYYLLSLLRLIKWTPSQVLNIYPKEYSAHLKKAGLHNTTHAYALSQSALQKLITAQTPIVQCSDNVLSRLVLNGELKAFITIPKVFEQEIFLSSGNQHSYISEDVKPA